MVACLRIGGPCSNGSSWLALPLVSLRRLPDALEFVRQRLAHLVGAEGEGVAQRVNDTGLYDHTGVGGPDGLWEPLRPSTTAMTKSLTP